MAPPPASAAVGPPKRVQYVLDDNTSQLRTAASVMALAEGTQANAVPLLPTFWQRVRHSGVSAAFGSNNAVTDVGGGAVTSSTLQAVSESVEGFVFAGGLFAQGALAGLGLTNAIILYMSDISSTEALAVYYGPVCNHFARLGYALAVISLLACVDAHAKETEALEAAMSAGTAEAAEAAVGTRARKRLWLLAGLLYLAVIALGITSLPFEDVLHYTSSREPRWHTLTPLPSAFMSAMDGWHATHLLRTFLSLVAWGFACSSVRTVLSDARRRVVRSVLSAPAL